jgi:flagellar M-ring protein FliF
MNFILNTLTEIWRGLSAGQRITLVATGILTASVLSALVWWSQKPQLALLFAGVEPAEASKMVDELRDEGVPFELSSGGRAIYVPSQRVYELRNRFAAKGMPKGGGSGSGGGGGVGFEIFDKPTFGLSDFLQNANYLRALQGELSRTIMQLEGVELARVLIVVPDQRLFTAEKAEAKASVFLQLHPSATLGKQQINAIRFLVANGVKGLKPNRVAIVDNNGKLLAENEEETTAGLSAGQIEVRRNVENIYASKVQSMLDQVVGPGKSVVRVSVDMNFDNVQQTEERFDSANPVPRSESLTTEESQNPLSGSEGVTGTAGNLASGITNAPSSTAAMSTSKKQTTTTQYEIGKTVLSMVKGAGDIKKVSVAVLVDYPTYTGEGVERKGVPRKPEEKQSLENAIRRAVGFTADGKGKRNDEIALEEVGFAPVAIPAELTAPASIPEKYGTYISWGGQVVLVLLALGLFLYFRSLIASARAETLKTTLSLEEVITNEKKASLEPLAPKAITIGDLSKLIKENPHNMAQSLKSWLSQS